MKLTLNPPDIPFMVGDLVWVAQPHGHLSTPHCLQGQIMQIIFPGGSMHYASVIRQRKEEHELFIRRAVYDLKPVGDDAGAPRISVDVELCSAVETLFGTREALLASQQC